MHEGDRNGDAQCWRCGAEVPAAGPRRPMPPRPPGVDASRYPESRPPVCADCLPGCELAEAAGRAPGRYGRLVSVATPGVELRVGEGARAVVLGIDRWDGCTQLRLVEAGPEPSPPSSWSWDAHDNAGTRYWGFYGGWSSEGGWRLGHVDLVPPIDPDATRLTLVLTNRESGERADVTVELDDARPPRPAASVTPGARPAPGAGPPPAVGEGRRCRWCGAAADAERTFCGACAPAFRSLADLGGTERPPGGPLVPLAVDVGYPSPAVDGRLVVLAVEDWGDHSRLRTVLTDGAATCGGLGPGAPTADGRWRLTTAAGHVHDGAFVGGHGAGGQMWEDVVVAPRLTTDDLAGLVVELVVAGTTAFTARLG